MWLIKSIKYAFREVFGLNDDYELLLNNQKQIMEELQELKNLEIQDQQSNYYDSLTLKNLIYLLIFLAFIGGGFWLYNTDFFNNSVLESFKSLGTLSEDLQKINQKGIFDALNKLNENSVNLSKEELKILLEIKNLLLARGINENKSLDQRLNLDGTAEWGDYKDN